MNRAWKSPYIQMKIKRTDVDNIGNNDCSNIYYWM